MQMFLSPDYIMFVPNKNHRKGSVTDNVHSVVGRVQEAAALSRYDYTVMEELRALKKELKQETLRDGNLIPRLLAMDKE